MTDVDRSSKPVPDLSVATRIGTPARINVTPGTTTPPWNASSPQLGSLPNWESSTGARLSLSTLPPTPGSTNDTATKFAKNLRGYCPPRGPGDSNSAASAHTSTTIAPVTAHIATVREGSKSGLSASRPPRSNRHHRFGQAVFKGREPLPPNARVRSVTSWAGADRIISEHVVEHDVKVPKRTTREDVIERTYVIPEKVTIEEIIEENVKVMERIVEIAQPVVQEKIVEVVEYEYIEKVVEVPHKVTHEKIKQVPRIEVQERVIEVPKFIPQEKLINVPVYEYHEVPVERIVEIPEIREQVIFKERPVPQYIERPFPQERTVEVENTIHRRTPMPVMAVSHLHLQLPKIRPVYSRQEIPVYVPRFVEVPVAAEFLDADFLEKAERSIEEVSKLAARPNGEPLSMCALEEAAGLVQNYDFETLLSQQRFAQNFAHWWRTNNVGVDDLSVQSVCQTFDQGTIVTEAVSLVHSTGSLQEPKGTSFTATTITGESATRLISAPTTQNPSLPSVDRRVELNRPPLESGTVSTESRDSVGSHHDAEYHLQRVPEARQPDFPTMKRISTHDLATPLPMTHPPAFGSTSSVDSDEGAEFYEEVEVEVDSRILELHEISTLRQDEAEGSAHTVPSIDGRPE